MAVVGGGVRALAVARACAVEGAAVALFAPSEIAAAADERAWPVLRAGKSESHRAAADLVAPQLLRRAIRRAATDVAAERSGCLTIATSQSEIETLTRRAAELKALGAAAWMAPTREIEALSPPVAGAELPPALFEQDAETIDADALALALAEGAAAADASLIAMTPVASLERDSGPTALLIGETRVEAGAIVLADDISAIRLIREGKGRLSLVRDERAILTTAAGAPAIGPAIEFRDLRVSRDRAGAIVASGPPGGDAIARALLELAPALGDVEIAREERVTVWRGVDGLAQVGQAEIAGLWLALGFGRDALAMALPAAEQLTGLIAGRRGAAAFAPFAPTRRLRRPEQEAVT